MALRCDQSWRDRQAREEVTPPFPGRSLAMLGRVTTTNAVRRLEPNRAVWPGAPFNK
jgi:hypothetical protein